MSPTCVDQMAAIFTERAVIFSPGSIDSDHSYFYFDSLPFSSSSLVFSCIAHDEKRSEWEGGAFRNRCDIFNPPLDTVSNSLRNWRFSAPISMRFDRIYGAKRKAGNCLCLFVSVYLSEREGEGERGRERERERERQREWERVLASHED